MKKSQNKLNEEDLLKDIDKILEYANSLSTLDIENTDLDKMENEIEGFDKNLREKYKEYLPKEDLDSEK
jgi:Asp-tRNA(Asn)/Glu-tRNA(Gln) amidotransferase C subunit